MNKLLTYIIILFSTSLCGCHGLTTGESDDGPLVIGGDTIDSLRLCHTIDSLIKKDNDTLPSDRAMRRFYRSHHRLCWITNTGITSQVDTLLSYIDKSKDCGLKAEVFFPAEIKEDKRRVDSLNFSGTDVYTVIARLDMTLTKSFLRYAGCQRYGFTNPYKLFNQLDENKNANDTSRVVYRQLYDTPTEVIGKRGFQHLASMAGKDSVSIILQEAEPNSPLYQRLKAMLPKSTGYQRRQILINMERCRWHHPHYPSDYKKYVLVNIPSYELLGVDEDSTIEMRIVCGSKDTKTPLLQSSIMRMDINPRWDMPFSIVKHDIAHHAGNKSYFQCHRYHIVDKVTGDEYRPERVTSGMLLSGGLRVYQEGGEGNALGRIIFRFINNFSIFLHDTSTKGTFTRMDRRASHGCIRVQQPFELAKFLLKEKDEDLLDRIHSSMTDIDSTRLIHSVKVEPKIPLFITYYTMYLMPDGVIHSFPDVYQYDPVIYERLKPFVSGKP